MNKVPRAPKKCGTPSCDNRVVGVPYCTECIAAKLPSPSSRAARDPAEKRRRAKAVAEWVAVHGWICPGWRRPPHPSHDLTAAHTVAVANGGGDSPIKVLCRSCNSRQQTNPL